jgi:hypothetical protein
MSVYEDFYAQPILNSPYEYPARHWKLDEGGLPTGELLEKRRDCRLITAIPKAKKKKGQENQGDIVYGDATGVSSAAQAYDPIPIINKIRGHVNAWRVYRILFLGESPPRRKDSCSTGVTLLKDIISHSFANWRLWKQRSGSPRLHQRIRTILIYSNIFPVPMRMQTRV